MTNNDTQQALEWLNDEIEILEMSNRSRGGWATKLLANKYTMLVHIRQVLQSQAEKDRVMKLMAVVIKRSYSHVDGRDLFAELKPRNILDIQKRIDGIETWHEGDWLTGLGDAIRELESEYTKLGGTKDE